MNKIKISNDSLPFHIEVKRFYVPCVLEAICPMCDGCNYRDFSCDPGYLSYPTANESFEAHFTCYNQSDDGTYCDYEFSVPVILKVNLELA